MIELLLKVSFALGIALLFYKLLLQQESFFSANRFYLAGCLLLAFALPFISLPKLVDHQGILTSVFQQNGIPESPKSINLPSENLPLPTEISKEVPEAFSAATPTETIPTVTPSEAPAINEAAGEERSWSFWLMAMYLFGVAIFALSLLFQIGSLFYKIFTAPDKIEDGDFVIVNTAKKQAPCSFFKYIFIHPDDYDFDTYEQIIAHEKIHAKLGHSFDLLLAELAVIVLWFNPLIWFFKREIEKNNEYQTDAQLLEKEQVGRESYQLNLLQIAVPNKPLSITTNYNQSLLKQRILMMNAKKSTPHAYWKYAFLAPLFFGTLLVMNEPVTGKSMTKANMAFHETPEYNLSGNGMAGAEKTHTKIVAGAETKTIAKAAMDNSLNENSRDKDKEKRKEKNKEKVKDRKRKNSFMQFGGTADMAEGYWYGRREGNDYCLELRGNKNAANWNISRCLNQSLFQKKGNESYTLTKESGTLQLSGNLEAEVSQGKYTFTEDASFRKYLAANNITGRDQNLMFHLFLADVNRKYVDFLKKNYSDVSGEQLQKLAIHGVSQEDFQEYVSLFEKYNHEKPSVSEVVSASIHGLNGAYVRELQSLGYKDLSLDKMMEAKIHGVNSTYIKDLQKSGFGDLTMDKIIQAKIHGVRPASIQEMQALGFGKLSLNKIIELKIHGVNANYMNDLRDAGLQNLTIDQVLSARIHGLRAEFVQDLHALGYKDLSYDDLISARIHGVSSNYIEDIKKAGFSNLSLDQLVSAKIHGVNYNFIQKARQNGHNLKTIDNYISLKIHGMAMKAKDKD